MDISCQCCCQADEGGFRGPSQCEYESCHDVVRSVVAWDGVAMLLWLGASHYTGLVAALNLLL